MKKVTIVEDFLKEPYQKLVLSRNLEDLFTKLNINDSISKGSHTINKFGFNPKNYNDWNGFVDSIKYSCNEWVIVAFVKSEEDISILITRYYTVIDFLISNHSVIESSNNSIVEEHYKKKEFNLFKDFIKI